MTTKTESPESKTSATDVWTKINKDIELALSSTVTSLKTKFKECAELAEKVPDDKRTALYDSVYGDKEVKSALSVLLLSTPPKEPTANEVLVFIGDEKKTKGAIVKEFKSTAAKITEFLVQLIAEGKVKSAGKGREQLIKKFEPCPAYKARWRSAGGFLLWRVSRQGAEHQSST